MSAVRWSGRAGLWLLVVAIMAYSAFPLLWAAVSSLKTGSALFEPSLWPEHPGLANYRDIFTVQPFGRNILNSLAVATGMVAVSLGLSVTAAYALGRAVFRGRRLLLLTVLSVSMFPQVAVLSGLFEVIRWLGLYNSLTGLGLTYLIFTLPFTVWVLTAFMRSMPRELEESALVDGAGPWRIVFGIFLPLLGPALVSTGLLAFIAAWNEFLFALTFTLTSDRRTVPPAIALMSGASAYELPWGHIMAASVVVTVPLIALVLVFQRRIVAGLTAGAVKG